MPITYEVDEARNRVHVKVTGRITEADLVQHSGDCVNDKRIKPGFRELFDATAAVPDDLPDDMIAQLIEIDNQDPVRFASAKRALVIPGTLAAKYAKEFEAMAQGTVIVFVNLDVAKTWLGWDD